MTENSSYRLSGIVLTQDNENTITAIVTQLSLICDEVIVVDGGSNDRTVELASALPKARVFRRAFDGNFAAQRNFALDQAKGAWTLSLDSDELLGDKALRWIPRLICIPFLNWYGIPRLWVVEIDGAIKHLTKKPHYRDRQYRLLRNKSDLRYVESGSGVHEKLNKAAMGYGRPLRSIHIFHYDLLLNSREKREAKVARYNELDPSKAHIHTMYLWENLNAEMAALPEPMPGDLRKPETVFAHIEQQAKP